MLKVQVRTKCTHCEGKAYLFSRYATSHSGEVYTQHDPCGHCHGAGEQDQWVSLKEFIESASIENRELTTPLLEK